MKFLHPENLKLLLILLVILPGWLYFLITKRRTRQTLGVHAAVSRISRFSSISRDAFRCILLNAAMAALIIALAHPQMVRGRMVPQPGILDLVFLLDTSPSMRATDIQPSRLARALEVIGAFSRAKLEHDRVALVSFAGVSMIISYLTEDPDNILYYLDYLKEDARLSHGTNIGGGIRNALTVVRKDTDINPQARRNKKVFILLSDGEDNSADLDAAVKAARGEQIKVHTVGVGSADAVPIPIDFEGGRPVYLEDDQGRQIMTRFDERTLQWIAEQTGGKFQRTLSGFELEKAFADIVRKERAIAGVRRVVEYDDFYHEFLLAAVGFLLLALLIPG
jgi:Ca-activated chloride channel family protein